jgi:hypothetical protein
VRRALVRDGVGVQGGGAVQAGGGPALPPHLEGQRHAQGLGPAGAGGGAHRALHHGQLPGQRGGRRGDGHRPV